MSKYRNSSPNKKLLGASGALAATLLLMGSLPLFAQPGGNWDNAVGVTRFNNFDLGNRPATMPRPPVDAAAPQPALTKGFKTLTTTTPPKKKTPVNITPKVRPIPPEFTGPAAGSRGPLKAYVDRSPTVASGTIQNWEGGNSGNNNNNNRPSNPPSAAAPQRASSPVSAPVTNNNGNSNTQPPTPVIGHHSPPAMSSSSEAAKHLPASAAGFVAADTAASDEMRSAEANVAPAVDPGPPPPPPVSFAVLERRPDFSFYQPSLLFKTSDTFSQGQSGLGMGPGLLGDSVRYVPIGEF